MTVCSKHCSTSKALRKSRRVAAFWMLSSAKLEEVSQDFCAFKLAERMVDR